jgi:hypothetical protein
MRATHALLALPLALASACTTSPSGDDGSDPAPPASVRERLKEDTRLVVAAADSTGSIMAAHYSGGMWNEGSIALVVDNGELVAAARTATAVEVQRFALAFQPIDLPESLLGHPATLTNLRVALAKPVLVDAAWSGDDAAMVTGAVNLDLSWTLTVDGTALPLGAPHLAGIPIAFTLSGDGARVAGDLAVHADGELWSWAGLVKIEDLDLSIGAATVSGS